MPRATTAAWEVMPPRVVRMPSAACMPWMSSGEVSTRTRMTGRPAFFAASASSEVNTISPQAAPGEAGRPVASTLRSAFGSMVGWRSWSREVGSIRATASSREIRPSAARSTAMRKRRLGGALARAGLQHPELAALDGELEVLHVAVVPLQEAVDAHQLRVGLRHRPLHGGLVRAGGDAGRFGDVLRRADAGDHVLPLGVDQELAVELASRRSRGCG